MFSSIKWYIGAIVTGIAAIFVGMYKYKSNKVDTLEDIVKAKEEEIEVNAKAVEHKREVAGFETKNEVDKAKTETEIEGIKHNENNGKYDPNTKFYI